jgi:hypothetical protein
MLAERAGSTEHTETGQRQTLRDSTVHCGPRGLVHMAVVGMPQTRAGG